VCLFPFSVAFTTLVIAAPRVRAEPGAWVGVEESYTDNVRSQPDELRSSDSFTTVGSLVGWEWQKKKRHLLRPDKLSVMLKGRLFRKFTDFDYLEVRPRAEFSHHRDELRLEYTYTPERLQFNREDDGDITGRGVFFVENLLAARLGRKLGARKQLRVYLIVEFDWRNFTPPDNDRDDFTPLGGFEVRYRLTQYLTPRVGFEYASRNAERENYDREDIKLTVGFHVRLSSFAAAKVEYERGWRNYPVSSERAADRRRNSNFGRSDNIHQVETFVAISPPAWRELQLRLRYKYRQGDSTRPGRNFDLNEFGLELSYSYRGVSW